VILTFGIGPQVLKGKATDTIAICVQLLRRRLVLANRCKQATDGRLVPFFQEAHVSLAFGNGAG
jgi:hypothetical protein